MRPIRLWDYSTALLGDSDLCAVFQETVLDSGWLVDLRVEQRNIRDVEWVLLLDSFFHSLVLFVVDNFEFHVDSLDHYLILLPEHFNDFALLFFIATSYHCYSVTVHYVPPP